MTTHPTPTAEHAEPKAAEFNRRGLSRAVRARRG
jgi:hypothetical protein